MAGVGAIISSPSGDELANLFPCFLRSLSVVDGASRTRRCRSRWGREGRTLPDRRRLGASAEIIDQVSIVGHNHA
jgi:hypothetical protein